MASLAVLCKLLNSNVIHTYIYIYIYICIYMYVCICINTRYTRISDTYTDTGMRYYYLLRKEKIVKLQRPLLQWKRNSTFVGAICNALDWFVRCKERINDWNIHKRFNFAIRKIDAKWISRSKCALDIDTQIEPARNRSQREQPTSVDKRDYGAMATFAMMQCFLSHVYTRLYASYISIEI